MNRNEKSMVNDNSNGRIPKLRFPGFTGEWKDSCIGDVADVLQGYGFPDKYQGQKSGELPFCKVGDISAAVDRGERIITTATNYIDYSLLPAFHARTIPVGSTIFAKIGEAIRSNKRIKTGVPCLIDNNVAAVKAKDDDMDDFLFYLMSQIRFADYSGGIVPSVNKSIIEAIPILLPPSPAEQQMIASCLMGMDSLISAQGQKVDALKERKKGLMQQLFPQPGETTPRLRFQGFAGDWEDLKFKDFTYATGKRNKQNLPYERYSISNEIGFCPQSDQFEGGGGYLKDIDCRLYIIVTPHSFAYNPARINVGSIGYQNLNKDVIVSSLYEVFKTTDSCDDSFLWHWLHTDVFHKKVLDAQEGGVRQYFYYDKLKECSMRLPSICEQQKIARCLSALDDIIAAEADKLEALKNHKKGLMQQLFPQPAK